MRLHTLVDNLLTPLLTPVKFKIICNFTQIEYKVTPSLSLVCFIPPHITLSHCILTLFKIQVFLTSLTKILNLKQMLSILSIVKKSFLPRYCVYQKCVIDLLQAQLQRSLVIKKSTFQSISTVRKILFFILTKLYTKCFYFKERYLKKDISKYIL